MPSFSQKTLLATAITGIVFSLLFVGFRFRNNNDDDDSLSMKTMLDDAVVPELLKEHTKEFDVPQILKVTEGVYVAVGYAVANSILLEGPESVVVVDVTESVNAARDIRRDFRKITDKPVSAIIYTHNHADHMNGASSFIDDINNPPEIWAHISTLDEFHRFFTTTPIVTKRAFRQFGVYNPAFVNCGIGPKLRYHRHSKTGLIYPNKFFKTDREEFEIGGMNLSLMRIPGETPDQIAVWYPEKRVLLPADDIYRAFPNLYAIRGTPTRDVRIWAQSLDKMKSLNAAHLVPSHTKPVSGESLIYDLLTDYKDAIQFVHDQTVRYMNKGLHPNDIVPLVKLPKRLKNHPFLIEYYGTVAWSVRGVFNMYLGWFSGNPVDLHPYDPKEKARHMVKLADGVDNLLRKGQTALEEGDYQFALELSSYVYTLNRNDNEAKRLRIRALKKLGEREISANGRNYYMTSALETAGLNLKLSEDSRKSAIMNLPLNLLFDIMALKLKAEVCDGLRKMVTFKFPDVDETITMTLRNSVVEISQNPPKTEPDIVVSVSAELWRRILSHEESPTEAIKLGHMEINKPDEFANFITLFEV
ncbi:linear primary-alkylsulfatase-like [Tubulanus polymorphus]|uniref:linear primary-alkylsulfatase-like n=1 Tax=Tubulanus polymorphus TaxID=672921 RepID=UPI003DA66D78